MFRTAGDLMAFAEAREAPHSFAPCERDHFSSTGTEGYLPWPRRAVKRSERNPQLVLD